jgi:hypothetical protein
VPHPLTEARLKLVRAQAHLNSLNEEVASWQSRHPYAVFGQMEPDTQRYVFRLRMFEPPPLEWGVLIGEIAHSARSCLDYIAQQLVVLNGKTPNRATQFPIFGDPCSFVTKSPRMIAKMSEHHRGMLEELQPYHRFDVLGNETEHVPFQHPLYLLSELSNTDKHRVLNPTALKLVAVGMTQLLKRQVRTFGHNFHLSWPPLEDGAELAWVRALPTGPYPKLYVDSAYPIEILLGQGVPLLDTLQGIVAKCWEIFDLFLEEIERIPPGSPGNEGSEGVVRPSH